VRSLLRAVVFGPAVLATAALVVTVATCATGDARGDQPRKTVRLPHPDAGASAGADNFPGATDAGFRYTRTPPDPDPPLKSARQWIFDLRYQQGDIFLVDTRTMDVGTPRETPRVMGRFALELFDHAVLIERVRFDFPFLGAPAARPSGPIALDHHVTSSIGVVFPQTPRGTRLELVDRSTDERWQLPWPAKEQFSSDGAGGDAGRP
jgi:hypothetical protein